jgi:hypothetical protein
LFFLSEYAMLSSSRLSLADPDRGQRLRVVALDNGPCMPRRDRIHEPSKRDTGTHVQAVWNEVKRLLVIIALSEVFPCMRRIAKVETHVKPSMKTVVPPIMVSAYKQIW